MRKNIWRSISADFRRVLTLRSENKSGSKFRYIAHCLLLLVCYLLEVTPNLFPTVFGTLPNLIIIVVICIAMFEKDLAGALFGLAGGLLLDLTSLQLPGFNAIIFLIIGCAAGLIVSNLLKNTLSSALLLCGGAALIYNIIYWLIFYVFRGVDHALYYFARYMLIEVLYTLLLLIPIYLIMRRFLKSAKA